MDGTPTIATCSHEHDVNVPTPHARVAVAGHPSLRIVADLTSHMSHDVVRVLS